MSKEPLVCKKCKSPILEDLSGNNIYFCKRCELFIPLKSRNVFMNEGVIVPNGREDVLYIFKTLDIEIKFRWYRAFDLTNPILDDIDDESTFIAFLGYLFNKSKITLNTDYLTINHWPFGILEEIYFRTGRICEFFVKETERSLDGMVDKVEFGLYSKMNTGKEELLIWGLTKMSYAFMAQEINRYLSIFKRLNTKTR